MAGLGPGRHDRNSRPLRLLASWRSLGSQRPDDCWPGAAIVQPGFDGTCTGGTMTENG